MPGGAIPRPPGDRVDAGVGSVVDPRPVHQSICVSGSTLPAGFRFCFSRWNRVWLQYLQMTRVFSSVSCPPNACGTMWSTSALLGCMLCS